MIEGTVILSVADGVGIITISSPEARNALSQSMVHQLVRVCQDVDDDDGIRSAVIVGADGRFCAGGDRREWAADYSDGTAATAWNRSSSYYDAFQRLGAVRVPTVAAVRGYAIGAGLNLALAADLRVVGEDARLIGFGGAGVQPGGGLFALINRLGGREAAAALGLFHQEISGTQAMRLGLAWQALPDDEVEARAFEIAAAASSHPLSSRLSVRSFRTETGPPALSWQAAAEIERGAQLWYRTQVDPSRSPGRPG